MANQLFLVFGHMITSRHKGSMPGLAPMSASPFSKRIIAKSVQEAMDAAQKDLPKHSQYPGETRSFKLYCVCMSSAPTLQRGVELGVLSAREFSYSNLPTKSASVRAARSSDRHALVACS